MQKRGVTAGVLGALALAVSAVAQLPVTGRPIPDLAWLDAEMQSYMAPRDIRGGLLTVSYYGRTVYQRGFGYLDEAESQAMPENALVRIADCSMPFTAAAVQRMIADGLFTIEDRAFDVDQSGNGVLPIIPYPAIPDYRITWVRIRDLLSHRGGWNPAVVGDWTFEECQIAGEMTLPSPPGAFNMLRFILGQPMQFDPDERMEFSAVNYLAASLIVEEESGVDLVTYLRQNILTPDMWVPSTDLSLGRTFRTDQPVREAFYPGAQDWCVFESECSGPRCSRLIDTPYGSWDHEARGGYGGLVISPATAIALMNRYFIEMGSIFIGRPLLNFGSGSHSGKLVGLNCHMEGIGPVNVFIWFDKNAESGNYAAAFAEQIHDSLFQQQDWPTTPLDGFWVLPGAPQVTQYGSYDNPYRGFGLAVTQVAPGSKLNIKPGTEVFVGTISTQMRIAAPLGLVRIGG